VIERYRDGGRERKKEKYLESVGVEYGDDAAWSPDVSPPVSCQKKKYERQKIIEQFNKMTHDK
jgi:hypothetical protein